VQDKDDEFDKSLVKKKVVKKKKKEKCAFKEYLDKYDLPAHVHGSADRKKEAIRALKGQRRQAVTNIPIALIDSLHDQVKED
jgi:hypothetical protein